jgi:hypothetical protein
MNMADVKIGDVVRLTIEAEVAELELTSHFERVLLLDEGKDKVILRLSYEREVEVVGSVGEGGVYEAPIVRHAREEYEAAEAHLQAMADKWKEARQTAAEELIAGARS